MTILFNEVILEKNPLPLGTLNIVPKKRKEKVRKALILCSKYTIKARKY